MNRVDELRKIELRMRIGHRRERWRERVRSRKVLREAERLLASTDDHTGFPRSRSLRVLLSHPLAASMGVAAAAIIGPSRLIRWGAWLLPLLMRK